MFALFLLKHLSHRIMTVNVQIAIFRAPLAFIHSFIVLFIYFICIITFFVQIQQKAINQ